MKSDFFSIVRTIHRLFNYFDHIIINVINQML